jgi:hypothetical protein
MQKRYPSYEIRISKLSKEKMARLKGRRRAPTALAPRSACNQLVRFLIAGESTSPPDILGPRDPRSWYDEQEQM